MGVFYLCTEQSTQGMITYDPHVVFSLILRLEGSVLPHTIPYVFTTIACAVGCLIWRHHDPSIFDTFNNNYAYQIFTFVLGFMLVFRCQLAYNRFWAGRSSIEQMTNNWCDAVIKA